MKILFINPLSYSVFPVQIASLSGFLKASGHETSYLELILKEDLDGKSKKIIVNNRCKLIYRFFYLYLQLSGCLTVESRYIMLLDRSLL